VGTVSGQWCWPVIKEGTTQQIKAPPPLTWWFNSVSLRELNSRPDAVVFAWQLHDGVFENLMNITNLSAQQLRHAANLQEKIAGLRTELAHLLGGASGTGRRGRGGWKMSASARAKIAAAQRARWAKQRGTTRAKAIAKPKRKISAAGRKRLAQLAKARWAKAKAAGRKRL